MIPIRATKFVRVGIASCCVLTIEVVNPSRLTDVKQPVSGSRAASRIEHSSAPRPIWVIAHRINDDGLTQALRDGANAVEFDVVSRKKGFRVTHPGGFPPDFSKPKLSDHLRAMVGASAQLGLIYLDYKGKYSPGDCTRLVAELRQAGLPGSGTKLVLSVPHLADSLCLKVVPKEPWIAPQFDERNRPEQVSNFFRREGFAHAWHSEGATNPGARSGLQDAIQRRDNGDVIRGVAVYTVDTRDEMRAYLQDGVDAIVTNNPKRLNEILQEPKVRTVARKAMPGDATW